MPNENSPAHDARVLWRRLFYGPSGLRAGGRLAIFLGIFLALVEVRGLLLRATLPGADEGTLYVIRQATRFLFCLFASWVMGRIEGRRIADYGLPAARMFRSSFWAGMGMGFVSITILLSAMRAAGVFRFGDVTLRGPEIGKWAALWALVFLVIALSEEFFYRGYVQYTLSTGVGFWAAALLLSAYFGFTHLDRATETWVGALNAGVGGLFFCLLLRRSGDLWMPIGFHTAWNWGQTYFYGVPNSGQSVPGHLLSPAFSGPRWLTGGTVGPEGSWMCTLLFAALWLAVSAWLRKDEVGTSLT